MARATKVTMLPPTIDMQTKVSFTEQRKKRVAAYADVIIGIKPRSLANTGVRRINPNFPRLNIKRI